MSIASLYRRNVGGLDRGIRLALGVPLIAAGLLVGATWGKPLGILVMLVGLVSLLTGITGRCPLYIPFGISTAPPGAPSRRASVGQDEKEPHSRRSERTGAPG